MYLITEFHEALCCSNPKMSQIKTLHARWCFCILKEKGCVKSHNSVIYSWNLEVYFFLLTFLSPGQSVDKSDNGDSAIPHRNLLSCQRTWLSYHICFKEPFVVLICHKNVRECQPPRAKKLKMNSWSHCTIHAMLMRLPCPASLSSGRDSVEWHKIIFLSSWNYAHYRFNVIRCMRLQGCFKEFPHLISCLLS